MLRVVSAHDSGRIINPTLARSQVEGGIIQGLGLALFEERVLDHRSGVPLNPTMTFRSVSPTFVADQAGAYVVQLVVNDGHVDSVPATVTISSGNTKPVANAGPNQTVSLGALVQLDGSGSTDVDGNPLTYKWSLITLPAGSTALLSNVNAVKPTFTADQVGNFVAQLIVNDGFIDSTPSTVTITTNSTVQPPTAMFPKELW